MTTLLKRAERLERLEIRQVQMQEDIKSLQKEKENKIKWMNKLKSDPMAWEQVAREKMNYLSRNEVLFTFVPAQEKN